MSYANSAALSADAAFRDRVYAACTEQAVVFKDDGRYSIAALARAIVGNQAQAAGVFELVCLAPGFGLASDGASIDDGQILSAVQATWPTYAEVAYPEPPAEPAP
jgi:hypothetical protein